MSVDLSELSIVQWWDDRSKSRCGYCKNTDCSVSHGMWAESLTVEDYQDLIDRGWRRSGNYCYKPIMQETCCPQYTIKCDAMNVSLSKSQKKIIKRFNKFLEDGVLNKKDSLHELQFTDGQVVDAVFNVKDMPNISVNKIKVDLNNDTKEAVPVLDITKSVDVEKNETEPCSTSQIQQQISSKASQQKISNKKLETKMGMGADPNKPPCKKAKLRRIERKKEKLEKLGLNFEKESPTQHRKSIEEFFSEISKNPKVKLRLHLVPTSEKNSEWDSFKDIEFDLYKKYQMVIHDDPPEKLTANSFHRFLVRSPLKIVLEKMSAQNTNFRVSAKLFEKYQMVIHNDKQEECDETQFEAFLVDSPLMPKNFPNNDGPGFGSFHQQYWLDDKLIAVGVIDILPKCISSVYFFYDPDYRNLTLGTYASLKEVEFTRSLQKMVPELRNYYMGFYIHSCPKMRYKGQLTPSYLACPETYAWVPLEQCVPLLDANKYSRLNADIDAIDVDLPSTKDLMAVKVVYDYKLMPLKTFKCLNPNALNLFNKIGSLIGKKCVVRMVFWIS